MRTVSLSGVLLSLAWLLAGPFGFRIEHLLRSPMNPAGATGTLLAGSESEPSSARIAYRDLYPMLVAIQSTKSLTRVDAVALLTSSIGATPDQLRLTLVQDDSRIDIPIGPRGDVVIPVNPAWQEGDAQLISNQPADSLQMRVSYILTRFPGEQVKYRWLWESMNQINKALLPIDAAMGVPPRRVDGLLLEFPEGVEPRVWLMEMGEDASLPVDAAGQLPLPRNADLYAANPTLVFSPRPERMLPLLVSVPTSSEP
ncbi:MAG: hypothetical protein HRU51_09340 [Xanthomonadales bacterium]|nr:hypothetical protein [Xanthomonadales bacterium]